MHPTNQFFQSIDSLLLRHPDIYSQLHKQHMNDNSRSNKILLTIKTCSTNDLRALEKTINVNQEIKNSNKINCPNLRFFCSTITLNNITTQTTTYILVHLK